MNPSLKNEVFAVRGEPDHIRSDNGPEFANKAVKRWLAISGVKTLFIAPGSPVKYQVSEQTIANVITFVSEWTRSGITVYGFLLPTCSEMVELEKNFSGFEKGQFIDAFKTAGGLWIETDQCKYYSFDGSHLQDDAALEFSQDLTKRIYDIEQSKN